MLGQPDRPLLVGPSAQLGPTIFALPQPDLGSTALDLISDLRVRADRLEQRVQQLERWRDDRLIERLRRLWATLVNRWR